MSFARSFKPLVLLAASAVAGVAMAGEPTSTEDTTKLKTYSVGGTKTAAKPDAAIATVERPKVDAGIAIEKPVMDMTPFTVTPVITQPVAATRPAPKPAPKPQSPAPVASAPAPAVARPAQGATGSTPQLPPAAAPVRTTPSPAGAVPQAQGASAPPMVLVPLSTPAPEYPRDAMMSGTQGYVVVEFTLNSEGGTQDISVVDSSPSRVFDQAARRAVARWKFEPLRENGVPVEKRVQRRIDFTL